MAIENVEITAGVGTPIAVDATADGAVQITKLAQSADGSSTPITADANGLLVNLGANNDVTVTGTVAIDDATPVDVAVTNTVTVAGTATVSGTVAATQSGTWNVGTVTTVSTITNPVTITDGSGSLTVDGTVTANLAAGTNNIGDVDVLSLPAIPAGNNNIGDVDIASIAAGDNNIGNVDIVTVPADPFGVNADAASATGSISAKLRFIAATGIPITSIAAGNNNIGDVDVASLPNVTLAAGTNTNEVVGDVAHDAPAAGNPVLIAGYASAAAPTDVSGDADAVRAWYLRNGAQATVLTAAGALIPGDVTWGLDTDVTRVIPGTSATCLGKAEDAGHTTGDTGVAVWGVRNDADAAFGADLDYTPFSTDAGGNTNVRARRDLVRVSVQSGGLTTGATAYTSGDQVGTQFTVAGVARASGGSGMIVGVQIISAADTTGPFDVVFTDSSITLASDNAAYAISDADALKIVGLVNCAANYDIGNNRIAQAFNLAVPYVCSGGTSLYAGLIARSAIAATPFAAATDLQLIVYVERN